MSTFINFKFKLLFSTLGYLKDFFVCVVEMGNTKELSKDSGLLILTNKPYTFFVSSVLSMFFVMTNIYLKEVSQDEIAADCSMLTLLQSPLSHNSFNCFIRARNCIFFVNLIKMIEKFFSMIHFKVRDNGIRNFLPFAINLIKLIF